MILHIFRREVYRGNGWAADTDVDLNETVFLYAQTRDPWCFGGGK
jgi:hypothetical protein